MSVSAAPRRRPLSWQTDPRWALVSFDEEWWSNPETRGVPPDPRPVWWTRRTPTPKPPAEAELAQPNLWASLYFGSRLVATWTRLLR